MINSNGASTSTTSPNARLADDISKSSVHHSNNPMLIDLVSNVKRIFSLPSDANFLLKYKDQDGVLVSLTNDNDLPLAFTTDGATLEITLSIGKNHAASSSVNNLADHSSTAHLSAPPPTLENIVQEKKQAAKPTPEANAAKPTPPVAAKKKAQSSSDDSSDDKKKTAATPTPKATPVAAKKSAEAYGKTDLQADVVLYNEVSQRNPELVSIMFDEATRGLLDSFLKENEAPKLEDIVNGNVFKKRKSTSSTSGSEPPSKKAAAKESSNSDPSDDEAAKVTDQSIHDEANEKVPVIAQKAASGKDPAPAAKKQDAIDSDSEQLDPKKRLPPWMYWEERRELAMKRFSNRSPDDEKNPAAKPQATPDSSNEQLLKPVATPRRLGWRRSN